MSSYMDKVKVWVRWDEEFYCIIIEEDASVLEAAQALYRKGLGVACEISGNHVIDSETGEILPYSVD